MNNVGAHVADSRRWSGNLVLPLAVGAYAGGAAALWPDVFGAMLSSYAAQLPVIPAVLLFALPIAALVLDPVAPLTRAVAILRQSLPRMAVVALIFCLGIAAFSTYKVAIPDLVPFYADPFLARIDAWLHGGDPGLAAHQILPPILQSVLALLYGQVWFAYWFGTLGFVAFLGDRALRQQYYWTLALGILLLGTLAATLTSSVGPILYDRIYGGERFADLVALVEQSDAGQSISNAVDYLLGTYLGGPVTAGTGISAMPSMHLAIATLNALLFLRLNRMAGLVSLVYLATILFGSVYLGWHYAIDGYVSIVAVILVWRAVGAQLSAVDGHVVLVSDDALPRGAPIAGPGA